MSRKSRWLVLAISTPLVVIAGVGGLLGAGQAATPQSFAHLRVFNDVLSLIMSSYVEKADVDKVMDGAMRGLADGLDPSSAYLTPDELKAYEASPALPAGDIGLVVVHQFWLRVVGVRDNSPAARAGIRPGDFIRSVDGNPTRDVSAFTGTRLLHGAPGSKVQLTVVRGSTTEPHTVDLVRESPTGPLVTGKRLPTGEAYVRVASFAPGAAAAMHKEIDSLTKAGSATTVIDLRGVADGSYDEGIAAARLFVKTGTIATLAGHGTQSSVVTANPGDGVIAMPTVLLVSNGTGQAAEVFAAALLTNHRADLVGEPTAGLGGIQQLVKLPENAGLWITTSSYVASDNQHIEEHGLRPTVAVESPTVEFGDAAPATDDMLTKALEHLKVQKIS